MHKKINQKLFKKFFKRVYTSANIYAIIYKKYSIMESAKWKK